MFNFFLGRPAWFVETFAFSGKRILRFRFLEGLQWEASPVW